MKRAIKFTALTLVLFALAAFAACGKDTAVTEIKLDCTEKTLKKDETFTLAATVLPENATDKTVTWTSSAPSVATVSEGKVTAVSAGTAEITAAAGKSTAKCSVTVLKESEKITIGTEEYDTLAQAIDEASEGAVIEITNGEYTFDAPLTIGKKVTLRGEAGYTLFKTADPAGLITVTAEDVVIEGIDFIKTDKAVTTSFAMLGMQANGFTVKNCTFTAQYEDGDGEVTRAILPYAGVTGYLIEGNTFENIRQPAYLEGSGTVRGNHVAGTRGFVVCANHKVTFEDNTFSGNVTDIAIIENGGTNVYTEADALSLSRDNHGAAVDHQVLGIKVKDGVKVTE